MVTVTNCFTKEAKDGSEFTVLELVGGLEMVQSSKTGRYYATMRRCTVPFTFDEATGKSLVGTQMPGQIVRVECEPFSFVDENTGEEITLVHRWSYLPEGADAPIMETVS